MASVVDDFEQDWQTQDRLYTFQGRLLEGSRSDWTMPAYNHIDGMTLFTFHAYADRLLTWQDQLAELLVDHRVESLLPGDRADSIGDRWAKYRMWTWIDDDERIELL